MKRLAAVIAALTMVLAGCMSAPAGQRDDRCNLGLAAVEFAGDVLPRNWSLHCPAYANGYAGEALAGSYGDYIVVDANDSWSGDALKYVLAHEICHARAWEGLEPQAFSDEVATDWCAAKYGFPPPPGWGY